MHDRFLVDDDLALITLLAPGGEGLLEAVLGLLLIVAQGGGFLKILRLDRGFLLAPDPVDLGFEVLGGRRLGHRADPGTGTCLIHDVDRLVGQEAAGQVAIRELGSGL